MSAAGTVFHLECPAGYTGSFERRCNGNGEWEEIENNCVRITCPEESFEGVMWPATKGGLTAVHSCGEDEEGGLRRVCRENGEWSSVVSGEGCYCEPTVVEERGTYIFARTEPLATVVKACATMYADTIRYTCSLGGWWTDLVKECERIACPGETMEGECSCPAEVVYHSDGNMYLMEEVVAGEVVSANMTGYVWRSWSTTRQAIG